MSSYTRTKRIDLSRYAPGVAELTIDEAASVVEGRAVADSPVAPVNGGTLRSSIYRRKISDAEAEVGATAEYAVYVEFGTRFMQAQPFLRPALDSIRPQLARIWRVESGRYVR